MINYKEFKSYMDEIKVFLKQIEKAEKVIETFTNYHISLNLGSSLLDKYIFIVEKLVNDSNEMIFWFVYDNNFGKKELQVYIKNKILSINSVKDLYNYFLIVNYIENNE